MTNNVLKRIPTQRRVHSLDWPGAVLLMTAAISLLLALTWGGLTAPYGKYASGATAALFGPLVDGRLAWVVQELPSLVLPLLLWLRAPPGARPPLASQRGVLLALFVAHYVNRTLVFPLRLRGGKPTPLGVAAMAFAFTLWNGAMQGLALTLEGGAGDSDGDVLSPRFVLGVCLFVAGAGINLHADHALRTLRGPGESGYLIPRGGAFELVSGANFFGEIVEWSGFALGAWGLPLARWPALAFAVFTAANIGPRALSHHAWLRAKFGAEYPPGRKALVPFVL
jgi:3-oxo-5-alpha-steroid 4-dehydrogenase 1